MNNLKKIITGILFVSVLSCGVAIPLTQQANATNENSIQTLSTLDTDYLIVDADLPEDDIKIPETTDDVVRISTNPASKLVVDGVEKNVFGYNINGTNFYHLRSLAMALKDTTGRFNILDESDANNIYMLSGYNYTGYENLDFPVIEDAGADLQINKRNIIVNDFNIGIQAYNISDVTFVQLKGFSENMGYSLNYTYETNTIEINTTNSICAYIRDKVYNPVFTYDPFTKVELSLEDINKILAHSSMPTYGQYFYDMQEKYNVNVLFAIAVAYVESGRGKYPCASYNYFGMLGNSYSSPQAGINAFGALMNKKLYYGKSIDQIGPIYCDSHWAPAIKSMMNEIWAYV